MTFPRPNLQIIHSVSCHHECRPLTHPSLFPSPGAGPPWRDVQKPTSPPVRFGSSFVSFGILDRLSANMGMDDADPARPDINRDGAHLMVRPAHLRDLDVPDPSVARREDREMDDAIRDELLHSRPRERGGGPLFRDHERRAPG